MADFSKQYCDKFDPEFPYDFDILEVYDTLDEGNYIPIICEGLGFIAIGKNINNSEPQLLFEMGFALNQGYWDGPIPEGLDENDCVWVTYSKVIN